MAALDDRPRPDREPSITLEAKAWLVSLACRKAALVGIGGDLEHGAAMIHPRLGMAMRRAIKRGRVIIPGHA